MPPEADPIDLGPERGAAYVRLLLTVGLAVAVVVSGMFVPLLADSGLSGSPAGRLIPLPTAPEQSKVEPPSGGLSDASGFESQSGTGLTGSGFGALNVGQRSKVGGSLTDLNGSDPLRSQDAEVHFIVETTTPTYWRTGAFSRYTGTGWERRSSTTPYEGSVPGAGARDERVSYRITLRQSANTIPTAWRPATVSVSADVGLRVTAATAIRPTEGLPAGTTIRGVSYKPPRDPSVLRTVGRDYPQRVIDRYTQLPAETRRKVEPFTERLTANASSPYETAVRIESWLERTKSYSLNVSRPPGDDVARQFIFDLDRGYCEYFATAMVVMLRSQGIPARYVIGYTTGDRLGADRYAVRAMNAHAWVEVYFPEVGWIRFDPTPAGPRISQERAALANQTGDQSYAPPTTPTESAPPTTDQPTRTTTDGSQTADSTRTATPPRDPTTTPVTAVDDTTTQGPTQQNESQDSDSTAETDTSQSATGTGGLTIELNRTPVPGARVAVSVTANGTPVAAATVLFNGRPVGRTSPNGTLAATVPYAPRLNVSVTAPPGNLVGFSPGAGRAGATALSARKEYNLTTAATVTVIGESTPGGSVTVVSAIEDVPVRNAKVLVNGTRVGTTDSDGRRQIRLPSDPGPVRITVIRGPVNGSTTVRIRGLEVRADGTAPLAVPFTGLIVDVTRGGEAVTNATVLVNGRRVDRTGVDGTARILLPVAPQATITVRADGQTATKTVSGLYRNGGLVGAGALLLGAVIVGMARVGSLRALRRGLRKASRALVAAVGVLDTAFARLAVRVTTAVAALRALLLARRSPREVATAVSRWLRSLRRSLADRGRRVTRRLAGRRTDPGTDAPGAGSAENDRRLHEIWTAFTTLVSARRPNRMTPGELAAHAIQQDALPAGPVERLRDAYRAAAYGPAEAVEQLDSAQAALDAIRDHLQSEATEAGTDADQSSPRTTEGNK